MLIELEKGPTEKSISSKGSHKASIFSWTCSVLAIVYWATLYKTDLQDMFAFSGVTVSYSKHNWFQYNWNDIELTIWVSYSLVHFVIISIKQVVFNLKL